MLIKAFKHLFESLPNTRAASLAYFAIFSLVPIFLIFIFIVSKIFGTEMIDARLYTEITRIAGPTISSFISLLITNSQIQVGAILPWLVAIVAIIYGAVSIFEEIEQALNAIWKVDAKDEHSSFLGSKIFSIIMMIALVFLLIVSFFLSVFFAIFSAWLTRKLGDTKSLITVLNFTLTTIEIWILSALAYKFIPRAFVTWKAAIYGGLVAAILFIIGRFLVGLYIISNATYSAYGIIGAIIVLLIWFYYSALIFLFGASLSYTKDYCNTSKEG